MDDTPRTWINVNTIIERVTETAETRGEDLYELSPILVTRADGWYVEITGETEDPDTWPSGPERVSWDEHRYDDPSDEFEEAMKRFSGKSKTGLRDWTRMEFMRGDINTFIDTLGGYKSTIAIGLGTITMSVAYVVYLELY